MASAVGISVLEVIEGEQLQKNSLEVGTYFLKSLAKLRERFEIIGDVRGKGLMIGVEMVSDRAARTPLSAPHVAEIWETCKDMGVLFGRGGLNGNVFCIRPPLCITYDDVYLALNVLETVCKQHLEKRLRNWRRNV
ncbi:unnamed protein product [Ceratitis capitata]|uniref:Alanine--glyoxylate aminotransferase 2, mitochondrial n=2 Tax=Ceratitis capitata TaxID=7213 RepID=A0A811V4T4_CERCA|nr:unnamed protein product [Ceratitis capitata]